MVRRRSDDAFAPKPAIPQPFSKLANSSANSWVARGRGLAVQPIPLRLASGIGPCRGRLEGA
jgi:hypothetical protein